MILAQLSDLHVRPRGRAAYRVCETNMLSERALLAVGRLRRPPDAVVISGDIAFDGAAEEYEAFAGILARAPVAAPVYLVAGNHDDRAQLRARFAHLPGVTADPEFIQYAVETLPVRLVILDTVVPGAPHGILCDQRLAWLDATLAAAPERPTLVVMHHPPFRCGIRHMDAIRLRNDTTFAALIARHKQVRRILCGHHHRALFGNVAHATASVAPSVAHQVELDLMSDMPGMWVLEPPAFHLHAALPDGSIVTHHAYVEMYPGPFPFVQES